MSETNIENVRVLLQSVETHLGYVEERMKLSGLPANSAVAMSVAKYWDVLEKLAAE